MTTKPEARSDDPVTEGAACIERINYLRRLHVISEPLVYFEAIQELAHYVHRLEEQRETWERERNALERERDALDKRGDEWQEKCESARADRESYRNTSNQFAERVAKAEIELTHQTQGWQDCLQLLNEEHTRAEAAELSLRTLREEAERLRGALRELLSSLPELWGDQVVGGLFELQVTEDAINEATAALSSKVREG